MFLALKQDIASNTATSLPQYDHHVCLVQTNDHVRLLSNICPHQNAKLKSQGTELICPYHGRRFDFDGKGIDHNYQLESWSVHSSDALLFDQPVSAQFPVDLSHMVLAESRIDFVRNSPLVIMDVFLDIEHIPYAHAGVYASVGLNDCVEISVSLFENGSLQLVEATGPTKAIAEDQTHKLAAVWMAVFPGTMIEWQPGSLIVTVAHRVTETASKVQVFKYHDSRYDRSVHELNNNVWETAWQQDRAIAESVVQMAENNLNKLQLDFRQWLNRNVESK
jgi:phenylpropionate dioxygenase-like ring-hydroxylating dioxygenase large terminal subunit